MDLRERGLRPPRGVLLVGVPGCGKSLSAKAIAANWNLPLYRLDLANIHGQYLGQSEGRLKEALATADRVAPCVLWIDEIEKGLAGSGSGGDGGTSSRIVGHFLYWLQEGKARVFVVSTANDITRLPPELFRRGRFDELFFVDLPSAAERREIISLYIEKHLRRGAEEQLVTDLVDISEGFAGSDLQAAVAEAAREAVLKGDAAVDAEYIRKVFGNIVPLSEPTPRPSTAFARGDASAPCRRRARPFRLAKDNRAAVARCWCRNMIDERTAAAAILGQLIPELEYAAPVLLERLDHDQLMVNRRSPSDLGFETGMIAPGTLDLFRVLAPYVTAALSSGLSPHFAEEVAGGIAGDPGSAATGECAAATKLDSITDVISARVPGPVPQSYVKEAILAAMEQMAQSEP